MLFQNKEAFLEWAASDEGKLYVNPLIDQKVTSGIATFKAKHPNSLMLGERLDKIEQAIAEKDKALKRNELNFFAFKKCTEAGVDFDLLEGFPMESEEQVAEKIDQLGRIAGLTEDRLRTELIVRNSHRPSGAQDRETPTRKTLNDYILEAEFRSR